MSSTTHVLPASSQQPQSSGVKIRITAPLVLIGSLVLAIFLWNSFDGWPFLLGSELLATLAGISLGWIFVGGLRGTQKLKTRISSQRTSAPTDSPRITASGFALGASFFAARAAPLREQVDQLEIDAAKTQKKKDEGDPAAAKDVMFDAKILEPEYAIGQGLISREEFNDFRNTYLAQSELSLGLILPLLFIVFGVTSTEKLGFGVRLTVLLCIVFATAFLFVIAMERRHKYRVELKLLLVSRWNKQSDANKAAKDAKTKANNQTQQDTIRKILQEELKGLHLEVKPLIIEVRKSPEKENDKKEPAAGGTKEGVF